MSKAWEGLWWETREAPSAVPNTKRTSSTREPTGGIPHRRLADLAQLNPPPRNFTQFYEQAWEKAPPPRQGTLRRMPVANPPVNPNPPLQAHSVLNTPQYKGWVIGYH